MSHTPLLYRPEEAATVLGIGRSKVFEFMASGELESVKIGRSRRVTRRALEDYVARLTAAQTPSAAWLPENDESRPCQVGQS